MSFVHPPRSESGAVVNRGGIPLAGLYNLIQEKIFSTYEDWKLRSSLFNCDGFHIVGIDNYLNAMRDGSNMFVEIRPPHAVKGCTSMKVVGGNSADRVDLRLTVGGKIYCRAGLHYDDAARILKAFVQKRALPDISGYAPWIDDPTKIADAFGACAEILLGDAVYIKQLRKKLQVKGVAGVDDAWEALCKKLVRSGRAVGLDWKSEREDFVAAVEALAADTGLTIDADLLGEMDGIPAWSKAVNAMWRDHILAAMDVNSEDYVLLVLTRADFARATEHARALLHRIARAEEM